MNMEFKLYDFFGFILTLNLEWAVGVGSFLDLIIASFGLTVVCFLGMVNKKTKI